MKKYALLLILAAFVVLPHAATFAQGNGSNNRPDTVLLSVYNTGNKYPWTPLSAVMTENPFASNTRRAKSRIAMSSSITKTEYLCPASRIGAKECTECMGIAP